jgi:hypothetical protein
MDCHETAIYNDSRTFTIATTTGYQTADVEVDNVPVGAVSRYTFANFTASHIESNFTPLGGDTTPVSAIGILKLLAAADRLGIILRRKNELFDIAFD